MVDRKCNQCNGPLGADGDSAHNCAGCLKRHREGKGVANHRWPLRTSGYLRVHLTLVSGNAKTGLIPVSKSSSETCPPSCALYNAGCFGENPRLRQHWKRVPETGLKWKAFLEQVRALPDGSLWRHNEIGDLAGVGESLDSTRLVQLTNANRGRRGFTFTHKHRATTHRATIQRANENGFTVNLSADSMGEAEQLRGLGFPVAVVLPRDEERPYFDTASGTRVVVCPATRSERVTCASCGLCQVAGRKSIVGFPAHGHQHRKISERVIRTVANGPREEIRARELQFARGQNA